MSKRAYAHAMALIANRAALDKDIVCTSSHGKGIVTVIDYAILDGDICTPDVESVSVEGEACRRRLGFDDGVTDGDVLALDREVPCNWLQ